MQDVDTKDVVVYEGGGQYYPTVQEIDKMVEAWKCVRDHLMSILKPEVDYGIIPGTDKKTLFLPGAEKIDAFLGYSVSTTITDESFAAEKSYLKFKARCDLRSKKTGEIVASAESSISSYEKKYRKQLFPKEYPPDKNGNYRDPVLIFDLWNTLEQMAQKRALVKATRHASGLSEIFTQDVEDMPAEALETASNGKSEAKPHSATPKTAAGKHNPDELMGFGKHKAETWANCPSGYLDWLAAQIDEKTGKPSERALRAKVELERRSGATEAAPEAKDGPPTNEQVARLDKHFAAQDSGSQDFWESFKETGNTQFTAAEAQKWIDYFENPDLQASVDMDAFLSSKAKQFGLGT